jgi:uncharacterized protein
LKLQDPVNDRPGCATAIAHPGPAPASAIELFVAEHLAYMDDLEPEGRLWASGPFIEEGVLVGDGLTILSTSTIEEARHAMGEEPLVAR